MKKKTLYILSIVLVLVLSLGYGAYYYYNYSYCYELGEYYAKGLDYTSVNLKHAFDYYRKSAEFGNAKAQYELGWCYANSEGVEKDYKEAVKWYRKSAEQGYAKAQYNLGLCYAKGEGVIQYKVKAYAWFAVASANGDETAKKNMNNLKNKMTSAQIDEALKLAEKYFEGKFD